MKIYTDISLKEKNTFRINSIARTFIEIENVDEAKEILRTSNSPIFLGEGSNTLFISANIEKPIFSPQIKGIKIIHETNDFVDIKVGAGENFDKFVEFAVENNYFGVENLSGIYGSVGAAPVQNIGAYGVEIKNVILEVETVSLQNFETKMFTNSECQFAYRESIFKTHQYFITSVTFRLSKIPFYSLDYQDIKEELRDKNLSLKILRKAILDIRNRKLLDIKKFANAGSFFKNPFVENEKIIELQKQFSELPVFTDKMTGKSKLSAAFLIEKCGFKGKQNGNVAVSNFHSLIIVNIDGKASGLEIFNFAKEIQESVKKTFGVTLEIEPSCV